MSLHNDFQSFLLSRTSVTDPICSSFAPAVLPSSTKAKLCITYGDGTQERRLPRLSFIGPFDYDPGTTSDGDMETKLGNMYLSVFCEHLDDAMDWLTAIELDFAALFVPGFFVNLTTVRIIKMIQQNGSKKPMLTDEVLQTGQEHPPAAAIICYKVEWQDAH